MTNHAFIGDAGTESTTLALYRISVQETELKPTLQLGSIFNNNPVKGLLVSTAENRVRANVYGSYGFELASRSTAGGNAARAQTFYSKTADNEYEAGTIWTSGEGATAKIYLKSNDGNSVGIAAATDSRNVVSSTPLPSAVNAVKALNPSVLTLSSGAIVTSFPLDTTKINAPFAAFGEETDVDEEGNPEYAGVDHARLVPLLTKALQETIAENEALKARLDAIESNEIADDAVDASLLTLVADLTARVGALEAAQP